MTKLKLIKKILSLSRKPFRLTRKPRTSGFEPENIEVSFNLTMVYISNSSGTEITFNKRILILFA